MSLNDSQTFVKDLYRDEMRNGFLVTSHRKRLWNTQIGLINEFARICKKYNLRWFAYGGTLLGAARHKGFIPWDDDVDLIMPRADYKRFCEIAPAEIKSPYFFDVWYNYRLEGENSNLKDEADLPLFTYEQQKKFVGGFPSFPLIKIRDSRTSMLEFTDRKNVNQGIWIDVFPLDPVPPFASQQQQLNFNVALNLFMATFIPNQIREALQQGQNFAIDDASLKNFLQLSYKQRALYLEDFVLNNFPTSDHVGQLRLFCFNTKKFIYDSKDFTNVTYLPFEQIELPAPAGYTNVLTAQYGDWHKMIMDHIHATDYSVDIPYNEYFTTSALMS